MYSLSSQLSKVKECIAALKALGIEPSLRHYDSLVIAAAADNKVDEVDAVGKLMVKKGIRRDAMYVASTHHPSPVLLPLLAPARLPACVPRSVCL